MNLRELSRPRNALYWAWSVAVASVLIGCGETPAPSAASTPATIAADTSQGSSGAHVGENEEAFLRAFEGRWATEDKKGITLSFQGGRLLGAIASDPQRFLTMSAADRLDEDNHQLTVLVHELARPATCWPLMYVRSPILMRESADASWVQATSLGYAEQRWREIVSDLQEIARSFEVTAENCRAEFAQVGSRQFNVTLKNGAIDPSSEVALVLIDDNGVAKDWSFIRHVTEGEIAKNVEDFAHNDTLVAEVAAQQQAKIRAERDALYAAAAKIHGMLKERFEQFTGQFPTEFQLPASATTQ